MADLQKYQERNSAFEIIKQFKIEQAKLKQLDLNRALPEVDIPKVQKREKTQEDLEKEDQIVQLQMELTALKNPVGGRPFPMDFAKPNPTYHEVMEDLKAQIFAENEKNDKFSELVKEEDVKRIHSQLDEDRDEIATLKKKKEELENELERAHQRQKRHLTLLHNEQSQLADVTSRVNINMDQDIKKADEIGTTRKEIEESKREADLIHNQRRLMQEEILETTKYQLEMVEHEAKQLQQIKSKQEAIEVMEKQCEALQLHVLTTEKEIHGKHIEQEDIQIQIDKVLSEIKVVSLTKAQVRNKLNIEQNHTRDAESELQRRRNANEVIEKQVVHLGVSAQEREHELVLEKNRIDEQSQIYRYRKSEQEDLIKAVQDHVTNVRHSRKSSMESIKDSAMKSLRKRYSPVAPVREHSAPPRETIPDFAALGQSARRSLDPPPVRPEAPIVAATSIRKTSPLPTLGKKTASQYLEEEERLRQQHLNLKSKLLSIRDEREYLVQRGLSQEQQLRDIGRSSSQQEQYSQYPRRATSSPLRSKSNEHRLPSKETPKSYDRYPGMRSSSQKTNGRTGSFKRLRSIMKKSSRKQLDQDDRMSGGQSQERAPSGEGRLGILRNGQTSSSELRFAMQPVRSSYPSNSRSQLTSKPDILKEGGQSEGRMPIIYDRNRMDLLGSIQSRQAYPPRSTNRDLPFEGNDYVEPPRLGAHLERMNSHLPMHPFNRMPSTQGDINYRSFQQTKGQLATSQATPRVDLYASQPIPPRADGLADGDRYQTTYGGPGRNQFLPTKQPSSQLYVDSTEPWGQTMGPNNSMSILQNTFSRGCNSSTHNEPDPETSQQLKMMQTQMKQLAFLQEKSKEYQQKMEVLQKHRQYLRSEFGLDVQEREIEEGKKLLEEAERLKNLDEKVDCLASDKPKVEEPILRECGKKSIEVQTSLPQLEEPEDKRDSSQTSNLRIKPARVAAKMQGKVSDHSLIAGGEASISQKEQLTSISGRKPVQLLPAEDCQIMNISIIDQQKRKGRSSKSKHQRQGSAFSRTSKSKKKAAWQDSFIASQPSQGSKISVQKQNKASHLSKYSTARTMKMEQAALGMGRRRSSSKVQPFSASSSVHQTIEKCIGEKENLINIYAGKCQQQLLSLKDLRNLNKQINFYQTASKTSKGPTTSKKKQQQAWEAAQSERPRSITRQRRPVASSARAPSCEKVRGGSVMTTKKRFRN